MKNTFLKLSVANIIVSFVMFAMLIIAEIFRVKEIFGVITGVYWIILDLAVVVVSATTGITLWKFVKTR